MKTKLFTTRNLIGNAMLLMCIGVFTNAYKVNAQATQADNTWTAAKFLGWGTTSGDLFFKTNNANRMTLKNSTGYFGIGTTNPTSLFSVGTSSQFRVDGVGNLIRIRNVRYSFPAVQGANGTVLVNNGGGTLTWQAIPAGPAGPPGANGTNGIDGINGTNGISLNWLGTFASPPASPSLNEAYYNSTDKISYIWNGTSWNIIAQDGANGMQNAWSLTGNAGTIDGTNFIGTTDNIALNFKVNNQKAGRIDPLSLNTIWGYQSGITITSGVMNTANGAQSLFYNTTGGQNTAIGVSALLSNTIGNYNSANGVWALSGNTTGNENTAVGMNSLYQNNSGNKNTALGLNALYSNLTGNNNTVLGCNADVTNGNLTNATAIGYNAKVSTSNSLVLGGTGADAVNVGIGTTNPSSKLDVIGSIKITDGTQSYGKVLTSDANGLASWQAPQGTTDWSLYGNGGTIDGVNYIGTYDDVPLTFKVHNVQAGRIDNGLGNTFFGYQSGLLNSTGSFNTATGWNALYSNTTGYGNTSNGINALSSNTTGNANTAIGSGTLYTNTTGNYNTALGYYADVLSGNLTNATAIGYNAKVATSNSIVLGGTGVDAVNVGIGTTTPAFKLDVNGDVSLNGVKVGRGNGNINTNTASGFQTLNANTSGHDNTAIGYQALYSNITGYNNTANGNMGLYSNTTGYNNIASGNQSLYSNTTGYENIAIGKEALYFNTVGNGNTSSGQYTLYNNTSGNFNTSLGYGSLSSNTIGNNNTALGFAADVLSGNLVNATAIGYNSKVSASNSLVLGSTGIYAVNVGIGTTAPTARLDVIGSIKITDGSQAAGRVLTSDANGLASWVAYSNGTGWSLTGNIGTADGTNFIGTTDDVPLNFKVNNHKAGRIDQFSNNTFLGYDAVNSNTSGYQNTAIGSQAMYFNSSGYNSTAIGYRALYLNQSGGYNTAVGLFSMYNNNSGFYNTALGTFAMQTIGNLSNATALGYNCQPYLNNSVFLGDANISFIVGQVGLSTFSDKRIKNQIQENVPGLEFINQLRPVTYHLDIDKENELRGITDIAQWEGKRDIEKTQFTGFIAQEVESAAKKINYDFSGVDTRGPLMSLRYSDFVVPLVKAVQEQQLMIEKLSAKIDSLQHNSNTGINNETGNIIRQSQSVVLTGMDNAYLGQNIPNPFSEETHIDYYIPEALFCNNGNCRIIFYDQLGRNIQESTIEKSGFGTINVSVKNLATGVYTYKLFVNDQVIDSKKMVFSK